MPWLPAFIIRQRDPQLTRKRLQFFRHGFRPAPVGIRSRLGIMSRISTVCTSLASSRLVRSHKTEVDHEGSQANHPAGAARRPQRPASHTFSCISECTICGRFGRSLGQRSCARRHVGHPCQGRYLAIFESCSGPKHPLHPNLTRVGGLVVPGCGSDCTYRVLGIVTDSGTSKTNQPEWVVPGS